MRAAFCQAMVALAAERPFVFLTGDLGFMALEPLRDALGPRFVNAGIAEQNMVSVAAGAAALGEPCWAYSIAPFIYGRPFEQVRNDICLHDVDVKLVGNGGGYGYGVMGATHHALEDYGVLLSLQHMRAFVPAFAQDVAPIVHRLGADVHPAYLRLGRCERPKSLTTVSYAPWRRLLDGEAGVMAVIGPLAGPLIAAAAELALAERPQLWVVSELPLSFAPPPRAFLERVAQGGVLQVVEEHVAQGGFGQMLAHALMMEGIAPRVFRHHHARGYPSGRYGSQAWHRAENGLDPASVLAGLARPLAA